MDKEDAGAREDANSDHSPDGSIHTCKEGEERQGSVTLKVGSPGLHGSHVGLKPGVGPWLGYTLNLEPSSHSSLLLSPVSFSQGVKVMRPITFQVQL